MGGGQNGSSIFRQVNKYQQKSARTKICSPKLEGKITQTHFNEIFSKVLFFLFVPFTQPHKHRRHKTVEEYLQRWKLSRQYNWLGAGPPHPSSWYIKLYVDGKHTIKLFNYNIFIDFYIFRKPLTYLQWQAERLKQNLAG